jgi:RimJ/RimL family protein N-acetyltransferase
MDIIPAVAKADLVRLESLACEIWREHYPPIIGSAQVEYMLEKFQSQAAMAAQMRTGVEYYLFRDQTDQAFGYMALQPQPTELFLSKLYVSAARRGEGHARQALAYACLRARALSLPRVTLTVNKRNLAALAAYAKLGFSQTGEMVTDIGHGYFMDDYRLEKMI